MTRSVQFASRLDDVRLNQPFPVPNQLASSKRRASLAEHEAVLAALATIARREHSTVMELLREGARHVVRSRTSSPRQSAAIKKSVWSCAPKPPAVFKSAAHAARFKRSQREFDTLIQELNLAKSSELQRRNSLVASRKAIRVPAFEDASSA